MQKVSSANGGEIVAIPTQLNGEKCLYLTLTGQTSLSSVVYVENGTNCGHRKVGVVVHVVVVVLFNVNRIYNS